MLSPQLIRDVFMPVHKGLAQTATELGFIPFFHCCGCAWDILEDWIDAGMKGYQSVQASAGMGLAEVKDRYGDKLTLWAGLNCETLVAGSLADIEAEVIESLKVGMPGGGFIFGANNSVMYGAKTENYMRALDLVREHGQYGNA
jgi:uroporphyrinogen-III decarboxylase